MGMPMVASHKFIAFWRWVSFLSLETEVLRRKAVKQGCVLLAAFFPHSPKVEETHSFTDFRQNKNDIWKQGRDA